MYSDKSYQSQLASLIPSASSSPIDLDTIYSEFFFSLANQKVVIYEIKTINPETPIIVTVAQNQVRMPRSLQSPAIPCSSPLPQNLADSTGGIIWETSYLLLQFLLQSMSRRGDDVKLLGCDVDLKTHCDVGSGCGLLPIVTEKVYSLETTATEVGGEGEFISLCRIPLFHHHSSTQPSFCSSQFWTCSLPTVLITAVGSRYRNWTGLNLWGARSMISLRVLTCYLGRI